MPTRKRKASKNLSRAHRTKSSKKKISHIGNHRKRLITLVGIVIVAVLGSYLIFDANAATSNFEAESADRTTGAVVGNDATASGGKYVAFSAAAPVESQPIQRFPGDPNPLVTGKAYWGAAISGNGDPSRHESATGKALSIRRTFWGWNDAKMISTAKNDLAANRLPHVSIKTPGWSAVASGKHDGELDNMLRQLDAAGGPVWFTVHHEPEGGGDGGGVDDPAGASGWREVQKRVRARMDALGTKNIAFMPVLMTWTWDSRSNRKPADWWVDDIWDAYIVDSYAEKEGVGPLEVTGWKNFTKWIEAKGLPYGTAEWGLRTVEGGSWSKKVENGLPWTNAECKPDNMVLKPTTEQQEQVAASNMQAFWDWGFANKKDVIAHTYFDSCLNSKKGPWTLAKGQLTRFQQILRDDQRVQRVKSLGSDTTTAPATYGTLTATVDVPENGTYKLWVRIKAPDSTNNAVQAQIDNGVIVKLGDGGLPSGTWSWIDYKNGDTANKASFALNAGSRKVTITGVEKGVKVDRILLTDETCKPVDMGENCATPVTEPPVTPDVGITTPSNGSTVAGKVPVKVTSTTPVHSVSFRIDDTWQVTDTTAPFEWEWDTTKFTNGSHRVVTRTRAQGDPGNIYTEKTVTVTVNNQSAPTEPPAPAKDTQAPTAPSSIRTNLVFDWSKIRYVMDLSWQASVDNNEVTTYRVTRNNLQIGTSASTRFTDSSMLEAGKAYTYTIVAADAANNVSKPASISLKISCTFIFCSANVL